VLRWTDDRLIGGPAVVRIGLGFALALIASIISYRLIEQPALRLKSRFAAPSTNSEGSNRSSPDQSTSVSATNGLHD
jgi:peptidoglycan/LPS O-acetylase OafA/YrhL